MFPRARPQFRHYMSFSSHFPLASVFSGGMHQNMQPMQGMMDEMHGMMMQMHGMMHGHQGMMGDQVAKAAGVKPRGGVASAG